MLLNFAIKMQCTLTFTFQLNATSINCWKRLEKTINLTKIRCRLYLKILLEGYKSCTYNSQKIILLKYFPNNFSLLSICIFDNLKLLSPSIKSNVKSRVGPCRPAHIIDGTISSSLTYICCNCVQVHETGAGGYFGYGFVIWIRKFISVFIFETENF